MAAASAERYHLLTHCSVSSLKTVPLRSTGLGEALLLVRVTPKPRANNLRPTSDALAARQSILSGRMPRFFSDTLLGRCLSVMMAISEVR